MKQKLITIILTVITILAPLLIVPYSLNTNSYILKFWTLLIGGLLLLLFLLHQCKNLKLDKKDICILFFLCLVCISTFLSSNITKSIFGENNRYEGLLMFITYISIYLSSKKYFRFEKTEEFWNILFVFSLIIGIFGIFQNYITANGSLKPLLDKGICSTFGNSNFFGSFISLVLPITISVFILKGNKKSLVLSLIMFFNMLSSGTRSAWVSFGVVAMLGIFYLLKQKSKIYYKRFFLLSCSFILIFVFVLVDPKFVMKDKFAQVKNDINSSIETGINGNMGSGRIEIWEMTLKLIAQKPIFGCGTDNLQLGLRINCSEDFHKYLVRTLTVVDKAHNEYLHIAATVGIPALILYCLFISMILLPKMKHMLSDKIAFIISITIISYLVQAFFNISTIGVAPLFWMILGLADNQDFINSLKIE